MADYTMLISSLPLHPPLFAARRTPLSRLKLDQRLGVLESADAILLKRIENLLQWENLPPELNDSAIVRRVEEMMSSLKSRTLQDIVHSRFELRTVVAALRWRRRQETLPEGNQWGFGRWTNYIRRYWGEPHFRLENLFPWIVEARALLAENASLELERLLLRAAWDQLGRAGEGHYFDFEAVVVYVLRWNLVARWTTYNGVAAVQRFDQLVDAVLSDQVQFESSSL